MAEEELNNVVTEDNWREGIAGDNAETLEALKGFETPTALFESHQSLANKNWRDEFAGDDNKFKSTLERFTTAGDMGNAYREAQQTIRSGQLKAELSPEATEDDIKAYRETNGIPLEAEQYLENLPDGLIVGEDDKEIMADFMGALHGVNADPKIAHAAIEWYNGFAEEQQDQLAESDFGHQGETEDQLRTDWGGDYRANINLVGALLDKTFGVEHKDTILNARDAEGRAIMNNPAILQGLVDISRRLNPIDQIISPSGDPAKTLNDEIDGIEKFMREERTKYNKDEKMQARLRELYEIRIQHEAA